MSLSDPRSRIVLHMNWKGQTVPLLFHGLPSKTKAKTSADINYRALPQPPAEVIARISPYAQAQLGNYKTPTYLVHGTNDDLIPWQQTQRMLNELRAQGVAAEADILEGAEHLFDMCHDPDGSRWVAVEKAYNFLFMTLGMK